MASCNRVSNQTLIGRFCRPDQRQTLTDSVMASSSGWRARLEGLCCLFECWLLRGVDEGLEAAPAPKLLPLRRWAELSPVAAVPGVLCAGESEPEGGWALEDDATAAGVEDIGIGRKRSGSYRSAGRQKTSRAKRRGGEGVEGWRRENDGIVGRRVVYERGSGMFLGPPEGMDLGRGEEQESQRH